MIIYQAIETRYLGPTNYRGSRVVARAMSGGRASAIASPCQYLMDAP